MTRVSGAATGSASLFELAKRVIAVCAGRGIRLALAESLTGGLLASTLVAVPGASKVLLFSVVAYHDAAKHQLLGVKTVTLATFGAVSGQTAEAMASGARVALTEVPSIDAKKVIGISTTGVAGPELQEGKAVGTAFIGLALDTSVASHQLALSGNRDTIRTETVRAALLALLEEIAG
jgi:nicotinamide-nucleotide amidase